MVREKSIIPIFFEALNIGNQHGCFDRIFEDSVSRLFKAKMLDLSVIHGDGTTTVAKKGAIIYVTVATNT
jgi:hypothetical protein